MTGIENLSPVNLEKVNIKFTGNVKDWLKSNQSHFEEGEPVISIFRDVCAWNDVDWHEVLKMNVENMSILDAIESAK